VTAVGTPSDAIRRAQAGDADAFEAVYREHKGRIYALCLRMTGDVAAAADLVQDVFVRAWEKLGSFRGESAFSSWLHRLAVNVVLMDRRTIARRAEDSLGDDEGEERGSGERGSVAHASRARNPGLRMDLEQAISRLPPNARRVLILFDIEGYTHAEIGAMMGIAEGTSKAHLFRARSLLKEALG